uniref:Brambleberry n=1 Tax=Anolis carolinensis TaxID=28377 RepID=A0A803SQZ5_ANOCA|nr:PREDICTED: uncharacterized protein LOC100565946 isoform X1 [Anolis carolinensis]|eukprot:XP_003215779.2 PREDICTED: uncharacterized protein LOC100565946 isoform X1 [Anolis carolinensis]
MGVVGLGPWSKLMLAVGNWMRISKARIALAFAHCHLQRSGRRFPPCEPHSSIRDCTQHMDAVAFGVYTEFFTHAHSICYFLHNEAWQQRAQDTVHRLTSSSESVARQLQSTNQLAVEIAQAQDATLRSQERILQDGEVLRQALHDSSKDVRQTFQELQDSALEQRVVFAEIFNRVTFLHRFVVGESSALYSLLFHILSGIASLVLTSCQRTSGARFILLTLVGVNIYLERAICSFLVDNSEDDYGLTESISFWVGMLRRGFAGLGFAVVAYFIRTYKDPAKQSQVVLQSLQETQADIQRLLQETERLLPNKTEVLLHESVLSAEDEALFIDSGFPEQLFSSDCGAEIQGHKTWRGQSPSRLCRSLSRQRSKIRTSSPKRRGRSPSRKCRSPSRRLSRTRSSAAQQLKIPVLQEGMHSQTRTSSPKQRGRSPSHKCYSPSRHLSRSRSSATQ